MLNLNRLQNVLGIGSKKAKKKAKQKRSFRYITFDNNNRAIINMSYVISRAKPQNLDAVLQNLKYNIINIPSKYMFTVKM